MTGGGRRPVMVIGVGAEFRCDDGAGPAVIRRLRGTVPAGVELLCSDGEPTRLIEAWTAAAAAIVVDALRGGDAAPGTLHRVVVAGPAPDQALRPWPGPWPGTEPWPGPWPGTEPWPGPWPGTEPWPGPVAGLLPDQAGPARAPASSHGLGLGAAIELGRALSRLPPQLILHAVQGEAFGYGQAFSPAVAAAIDDLTARVRADALSASAD